MRLGVAEQIELCQPLGVAGLVWGCGRSVCSPNITLVAVFGLRLCFRPGYMLGTVLRAAQCAACLDAPRLQPRWCWPSFTSSHGPRQPRWDVSSTRRWSSGPSSSAPYFHGCTLFRPGNGDVHAPGCSSGSARRPVGARKQRTSTNSSAGTEPWRSGRGGGRRRFVKVISAEQKRKDLMLRKVSNSSRRTKAQSYL